MRNNITQQNVIMQKNQKLNYKNKEKKLFPTGNPL